MGSRRILALLSSTFSVIALLAVTFTMMGGSSGGGSSLLGWGYWENRCEADTGSVSNVDFVWRNENANTHQMETIKRWDNRTAYRCRTNASHPLGADRYLWCSGGLGDITSYWTEWNRICTPSATYEDRDLVKPLSGEEVRIKFYNYYSGCKNFLNRISTVRINRNGNEYDRKEHVNFCFAK